MRKYKKLIQPIVLVLLTLLIFCPLFYVVSASGGFTTQDNVTKLWYDYNTSMDASAKDTYPYNEKDSSGNTIHGNSAIQHVAFDVVYGIKRSLVSYTGEIPYKEGVTYDKNGDPNDGFDGLPYNANNMNPSNTGDYWGNISISGTLSDFEGKNNGTDGIVSLRLYALSTASSHGIFSIISGFFYRYVVLNLAWLASLLVQLVIQVKNFNMTTIMEALQIEELSDVIYDLFIANRDASGKIVSLSPLMVISIVCFVFTLVAFVLNYVRGQKKERNLWSDILLLLLVGLILVGVGGGDPVLSLGNTASDLVNGIVASTTAAASGTDIWWTGTQDTAKYEANNTQNTIANEITMVNKILIDMEICNQFGVSEVGDLKYDALDKKSGALSRYNDTLKEYYVDGKAVSIGAPKTVAELTDGNLGYYFWYASSPAKQLRLGSTVPESGNDQQQKLSQMITYLQKVYNNADANSAEREQILNIIRHFSSPSVGAGMLRMLILIVIYVMLAFVLAMYALKVVMNKLQMFVGILAIPVGGALIASTKPQLVKAGKGILGILIMALIRLTVFGLFFDVILYSVNAVLTTEFNRLIIVLIMLFVFLKFRKAIDIAIERALSKLEGQIAPQAREFKAMARNYARRKIGDARRWNEKHGKIVGYDEDGKAIRKSSRGGLFDTMLNVADNAMSQDAVSHKGWNKIRRDAKKDREKAENEAMSQINQASSRVQDKQYDEATRNVNETLTKIAEEEKEKFDELYDEKKREFVEGAELTDEEVAALEDLAKQREELEAFAARDEYVELRRKQPSELTEPEILLLNSYIQMEMQMEEDCKKAEEELKDAIKARLHSETIEEHQEELEKAISKAKDIQEQIIETSGVSNLDKNSANPKTLKLEDFENKLLHEIQLQQLENGEELSTGLSAEEKSQAAREFNEYLIEHHLEQYGNDKKVVSVKQPIAFGKKKPKRIYDIELKNKQNKIRREETIDRTEANQRILNAYNQEKIDEAFNASKKKKDKAESDQPEDTSTQPETPVTTVNGKPVRQKQRLNGVYDPTRSDDGAPLPSEEVDDVAKAEAAMSEAAARTPGRVNTGAQTGRKSTVEQPVTTNNHAKMDDSFGSEAVGGQPESTIKLKMTPKSGQGNGATNAAKNKNARQSGRVEDRPAAQESELAKQLDEAPPIEASESVSTYATPSKNSTGRSTASKQTTVNTSGNASAKPKASGPVKPEAQPKAAETPRTSGRVDSDKPKTRAERKAAKEAAKQARRSGEVPLTEVPTGSAVVKDGVTYSDASDILTGSQNDAGVVEPSKPEKSDTYKKLEDEPGWLRR